MMPSPRSPAPGCRLPRRSASPCRRRRARSTARGSGRRRRDPAVVQVLLRLVPAGEAVVAGRCHIEHALGVKLLVGDGRAGRLSGQEHVRRKAGLGLVRGVGREVAVRERRRRRTWVVVEKRGRVGHPPGVGELAVQNLVAGRLVRRGRQLGAVGERRHAHPARSDRAEQARATAAQLIGWLDHGMDAPLPGRQCPQDGPVRHVDLDPVVDGTDVARTDGHRG